MVCVYIVYLNLACTGSVKTEIFIEELNIIHRSTAEMIIFSLYFFKVREAKPVVNTKGIQTPAHIQQKLKKIQVTH